MSLDISDLDAGEGGPWPAFADLLAATTLLFLILFTVGALPAIVQAKRLGQVKLTIDTLSYSLQQEATKNKYEVQRYPDRLLIRIKGDATFPKDASAIDSLSPEGRAILSVLAATLNRKGLLNKIEQIEVAGHTSSEGSVDHNWTLSAARASSVALFLIEKGLSACKVTALGRGSYFPVDTTKARLPEGRPEDRRIEIEIRPAAGEGGGSEKVAGCRT
jgi:outer membrane protein OmpA-like peptidoglycan-associated protein